MTFQCFKCGKISHFSSKRPLKHKRQTADDDESYSFNKYSKKVKHKKKSLCVNDVESSEETHSDSSNEDEVNNVMLMAIDDFRNEYTGSELNEEEAMVDMEGELISDMEETNRLRLKKRKQKQLLLQYKMNDKEPSEDIALLKLELEEAKKIEDLLKQQLTEGKKRCEALEEEVVTTRKELAKFQDLYHHNLSSIKAS